MLICCLHESVMPSLQSTPLEKPPVRLCLQKYCIWNEIPFTYLSLNRLLPILTGVTASIEKGFASAARSISS